MVVINFLKSMKEYKITVYYIDNNINEHKYEEIWAVDGCIENMSIFTKKGRKQISEYIRKNAKENNISITNIVFCLDGKKYNPLSPELILKALNK